MRRCITLRSGVALVPTCNPCFPVIASFFFAWLTFFLHSRPESRESRAKILLQLGYLAVQRSKSPQRILAMFLQRNHLGDVLYEGLRVPIGALWKWSENVWVNGGNANEGWKSTFGTTWCRMGDISEFFLFPINCEITKDVLLKELYFRQITQSDNCFAGRFFIWILEI